MEIRGAQGEVVLQEAQRNDHTTYIQGEVHRVYLRAKWEFISETIESITEALLVSNLDLLGRSKFSKLQQN